MQIPDSIDLESDLTQLSQSKPKVINTILELIYIYNIYFLLIYSLEY